MCASLTQTDVFVVLRVQELSGSCSTLLLGQLGTRGFERAQQLLDGGQSSGEADRTGADALRYQVVASSAKVWLLCCLSPASTDCCETIRMLKFAVMARDSAKDDSAVEKNLPANQVMEGLRSELEKLKASSEGTRFIPFAS